MLSKAVHPIGLLCIAGVLTLSGCKKDVLNETIEEEATPQPLLATELCELYQTYITLTDPLQGAPGGPLCSQGPALNRGDFTPAERELFCRRGSPGYKWGQTLLSDIETGRINVNWERAHTCLNESLRLRQSTPPYKLLTNPEWKELGEGACFDFYRGQVKDGAPCVRDWDCEPDSWCTSETPFTPNTQVCIKERHLGEACTNHVPCQTHLLCEEERCVNILNRPSTPKLGSSCTLTDQGDLCTAAGPCIACRSMSAGAPTTCSILGGEGEYCETKSHCVSDLGCTNATCTTVDEGAPCMVDPTSANQSVCSKGTVCVDPCWVHDGDSAACDASEGCTFSEESSYCNSDEMAGACTKTPQAGSACLLGTYCGNSAFCDTETDQCVALHARGESCIGGAEDQPQGSCQPGLVCFDSTCRGHCTYNEDCLEAEYCDHTSETELPSCKPLTNPVCQFDSQCDESEYCDRCELQNYNQAECTIDRDCSWVVEHTECLHVCNALSDETACGGNPECLWSADTLLCGSLCDSLPVDSCQASTGGGIQRDTSCTPGVECSTFNDSESCDASGCFFHTEEDYCGDYCTQFNSPEGCSEEPTCQFDSEWRACSSICPALSADQTRCDGMASCQWNETPYCAPATDCIDFTSSDTACNASDSCQWYQQGTCGPATLETTFECAPKGEIGDKCTADTMCTPQGQCALDEDEEARCQYSTPNLDSNCNYTSMGFLRGAFLFGFVFALRRRRQRRC